MFLNSTIRQFIWLFLISAVGSIKPENYKSAVEGSSVEIECGKNPLESGFQVSWSKNRIDLTNKDRFKTNDKGSLIINPVEQDDNGLYTCASQRMTPDGELTLSVNMYLNVKFTPHIFNIKPFVEVYRGENAVLPCSASGNPGVNFRWLDSNGKEIKNNDKVLIAHNGSLIVRNVTSDDSRRYTCAPYNDIGDGKFGYTELFVLITPAFLTFPDEKVIVREGENATLDCTASGIPKPNITWAILFVNISLDPNRFKPYSNGHMNILDVRGCDAAHYECTVESRAGLLNRVFELIIIGKPGVPFDITLTSSNNIAHIKWKTPYTGGSPLSYQFWYRNATDNDYQWVIQESDANITSFDLFLPESIVAREVTMTFFFSMRAMNRVGFGDFGTVFKFMRAPSLTTYNGQPVEFISEFPLAPYDFHVNITTPGYSLKWKNLIAPGRPPFSHVLIEYRKLNSTDTWLEIKPRLRKRRSTPSEELVVILNKQDFPANTLHPVEFQLISVSKNGKRSEGVVPKSIILTGFPGKDISIGKVRKNNDNENGLVPIVLGIIFGLFIIILLISLLHFYRKRKSKKQGKKLKNQTSLEKETSENGVILPHMDGSDSLLKHDPGTPRHFHLRTCPALKLGRIDEVNIVQNENNGDVTHALLEPNRDEKRLCTCSKSYVTTLDRREQNLKRNKKMKLFKSNSMPSIFINSDLDDSNVDPLEDEEYEVSDLEKDKLTELNQDRFNSLKRSNFKDSYDQFCRGDPDLNSRNNVNHRNAPAENAYQLDNLSDISDIQPYKPIRGFVKNGASFQGDESNSTSDSESIDRVLLSVKSNKLGFSSKISTPDVGYVSDVSSRSAACDGKKHYQPPSQRHKYGYNKPFVNPKQNFEKQIDDRPLMPPSYSEAIQVIERLSEKNDITDSEEMYGNLLQMERQLGLHLDDSIDSDLNSKSGFSPPVFRTGKNGYSSDTGYMQEEYPASRDIYSDREKNERCKQLLNEFKSSRSTCSDTSNRTNNTILPPYEHSHSPIGNIIEEASPPALIRSNSIGSNSAYKEWLV